MEVRDQVMYHFHKIGKYDEIWKEGNSFTVDDKFQSNCCNRATQFSVGRPLEDHTVMAFDDIIDYYLKERFDKLSKDDLRFMLEDAKEIIKSAKLFSSEMIFEEYRKKHCSENPCRLHSIWLIDEEWLKYWINEIVPKSTRPAALFKVMITGNLFKSSGSFLPKGFEKPDEMFEVAKKWWNPLFETDEDIRNTEYIFQGKVKILEKINYEREKDI